MFFIAHRERELTMHPSFFDSAATEKIKEQLHSDLEGTIEGTLMIIQIIEIDEISEPMLVPGTGMAKYNVSYRALVWRPFRGEVVDGLVTSVVNNGFFVDVGGMSVFVSKAVCGHDLTRRGVGVRTLTCHMADDPQRSQVHRRGFDTVLYGQLRATHREGYSNTGTD